MNQQKALIVSDPEKSDTGAANNGETDPQNNEEKKVASPSKAGFTTN